MSVGCSSRRSCAASAWSASSMIESVRARAPKVPNRRRPVLDENAWGKFRQARGDKLTQAVVPADRRGAEEGLGRDGDVDEDTIDAEVPDDPRRPPGELEVAPCASE